MSLRCIAGILIFSCMAFSETHIAGNISKMTFDRTGNPYIVEKDIIIPSGEEVTIKEGCVFLFNAFTGLTVQGKIVVLGSNSAPVVFTSLHDNEINPESKQLANPFDWNGVLISRESSSSIFKNFALRYSVYGIKAQTQNIYLENGIFRQNGQFHFTINDKIEYVQDNLPYSYGAPLVVEALQNGKSPQTGKNSPSKKVISDKNALPLKAVSPTRKAVRMTGLSVGIACGVGTLATGVLTGIKFSEAVKVSKATPPGVRLLPPDEQKPYTDASNKANAAYTKSIPPLIIFGALSAIGFTTFALTFAF